MNRLIVAFEGEKQRALVREALETGGIVPRAVCATGAEVLRRVRELGRALVVCGHKFPDMSADQLAYDLGNAAIVLVIAKNIQLSFCEHEGIFKLPAPFSRSELVASVALLGQLEEKSAYLPHRTAEEEAQIRRAKDILMRSGMAEAEAHRHLQRRSMQSGERMAVIARRILKDSPG
jgi:CheY-like chemotaxis protein